MVDGRLEWREWDAQDGTKRQAVEIIAENTSSWAGAATARAAAAARAAPPRRFRSDAERAAPSAPAPDEDDIPF